MATMQDLIEQWKKEAAQSQTVTGKDIPWVGMYQAQNDEHRAYDTNSALETAQQNQSFLDNLNAQTQAMNNEAHKIQTDRAAIQTVRDLGNLDVRVNGDLGVYDNAWKTLQAQKKSIDQNRLNELADVFTEAEKNYGFPLTYRAQHWENPYLSLSDADKDIIKTYIQANKDRTDLDENEKKVLRAFSRAYSRAGEKDISIANVEENTRSDLGQKLFSLGAGFNSFNFPLVEAMAKTVNKLPILNQISDEQIDNAVVDYNKMFKDSKNRDSSAYEAGRGAGQIYDYLITSALTNGALDKLGLGAKGAFAANQALQLAQDLGLDILPEAQRMQKEEGEINWGRLLYKAAEDAGLNLAMGIAPTLAGTSYDYLTKTVGNNADIFKNMSQSGKLLENAADISKAARDTLQAENALADVEKSTEDAFTEGIRKRADELAAMNAEGYKPPVGRHTAEEIAGLNTNPVEAYRIPEMENPKVDMELPVIERNMPSNNEIKALNDELSNMWGDSPKNAEQAVETAQNAKNSYGRIELPEEVTEKGASDFQEIYDSLENMRKVAEASGDEKVLAKFDKLSKAVNDYENAFFKNESEDALISAKKATDAARQGFIREVKKTNPNYTGDLTGTKLGNAAYRRTSMKAAEEANQELADSITEADNMLNTNRWAKDAAPETQNPFKGAENAAEVTEDVAKTQNIDPETITVKELPANSKRGVRYQVVSEKGNLTVPLENKKLYKTAEEAQTVADGLKNEYSVPETKTRLKMDLMHQADENNVRHGTKTTEDLWDELKAGENAEAPKTAKAAKETVEEVPEGKKLSRLYTTLQNTDKLTDAEKATFKNKNGFEYDPQNQKKLDAQVRKELAADGAEDAIYERYMNKTTTEPYTGEDTHRMFQASAKYNAMVQEALEEGHEGAAKLYAAKARNLMLEERYHATSGGQFNAAIGYYARTPQGYVEKAYDVLADKLQKFNKKNPKLSRDIDQMSDAIAKAVKDVDVDGIMSGADEAAKESLRARVLDSMNQVIKNGNAETKKIFKDLSPQELDNIITSKYQKDLARNLDMFAMGSFGVREETVDKVLNIMADAEKYDIKSKKYVELEKQAFDLLMNDLNGGKGKSFAEKFDNWRYLSMLFNPLTWTKNITGNFNNGLITGMKNTVAAGIEEIADAAVKKKGLEGIEGGRTKAILTPKDADLVKKCAEDFDNFAYRDYVNGGRYIDVARDINSAGDMYADKGIGKLLNKANNFNNDVMLGGMDVKAGKAKYQTSMAGFLKSNGATPDIFKATDEKSLKLLAEAREYSLAAANDATFHTSHALSTKISNFIQEGKKSEDLGYRAVAMALDFIMPFIKTPGNILRACLSYSPLEFLKVAAETKSWQQGVVSTAQYIDDISKGLTGTGLMVLGAGLAEAGLLDVSTGDADLDSFRNKKGLKVNALPTLSGKRRLSLANLVPGAMPVFWGAMVWNGIKDLKKGDKDSALDTFFNGVSVMGDTLTDLTMLSGITDVLDSIRYANSKGEAAAKVMSQIGTNAASQVMPTLGRKIGQTIDDTTRTTYSEQSSNLLRGFDSSRKYLQTKIPGLQELGEKMEKSDNSTIANIGDKLTNEPKINGWGQEVKNQDYGIGVLGRAAHNFVDIFDTTDVDMTERDKILQDIYTGDDKDKGTKDKNVLQYSYVSTSDANVSDYRMSEKEWTQYQKESGDLRGELLDSFAKTPQFKEMSNADKAKVIDELKTFSKDYTQYSVVGDKKELSSSSSKLKEIYDTEGADALLNEIVTKEQLAQASKDSGVATNTKAAQAAKEAYESGDKEKGDQIMATAGAVKEVCDKYDIDTSSTGGKKVAELIEKGNTEEADKIAQQYGKQKEILDKYDLASNSRVADDVLEAVQKNKLTEADRLASDESKRIKANAVPTSKLEDYKNQLDKYDLKDNDTTKHVYKAYGSAGVESYSKIGSEGISRYETARASGDTIPSLKEYAKTYSEIDSYGEGDSKNNKKVDQKEFAAYAQAKGLSQDEAREQAKLYGDEWKYVPTLQSDGSYKFTDPNKQSSGGGKKSSGGQAAKIYASAQAEGNAPEQAEFNSTYKAIDSYGTSNGRVTQAELISYGIANGMNEAQIQALARTYGDWTKIPVLQPDGTYQWKKVR